MNNELSAGTTFSHYRIVSKIGAGGMGEVFLAEDTDLERQVAVKVLRAEIADDEPEADLQPGPNAPVGVVWMALSKPHYGIHGTSNPDTIGYASSHGCVRLTNWDALDVARRTAEGTQVEFVDTRH